MRPLRYCLVVSALLLIAPVLVTAQQSDGSLSPSSIGWPTYAQHGQELMIPVTVSNSGDASLSATVSTLQLSGPPNWLSIDQASVSVPALDQTILNVTLNNSGVLNMPGQIVTVEGWVLFAVDSPTATDSLGLFVQLIVADTIVLPIWDTIATSCLALSVGSNGNMGQQGVGGANMNYLADCDDSDTIPGDASVYLYDASPVVFTGGQHGTWSMYTHQNAWYPIAGEPAPMPCPGEHYNSFFSGSMVDQDTSLILETTVFAPTDIDSCDFVIHAMRISAVEWWQAQSGITIGMLLDWNIPSDSMVNNRFGVDLLSGVYWQRGQELNNDPEECQENDARFGGYGLIGYADQSGEVLTHTLAQPGRAAEVFSFMDGSGDLDPAQVYGLLTTSGPAPGSPTDLLTAVTVLNGYNLAARDTLIIWSVLATVENGTESDIVAAVQRGRAWFSQNQPLPFYLAECYYPWCCELEGDVNGSGGQPNLTDLTLFVNCLFVTFQCQGLCKDAMDVNNDCEITLSDLTNLVNGMFLPISPSPIRPCDEGPMCDWE